MIHSSFSGPETHDLKTGRTSSSDSAAREESSTVVESCPQGLGASDQLKALMDSCWASKLQWSDVISLGEKHVVSVEGCMAFHGGCHGYS